MLNNDTLWMQLWTQDAKHAVAIRQVTGLLAFCELPIVFWLGSKSAS